MTGCNTLKDITRDKIIWPEKIERAKEDEKI